MANNGHLKVMFTGGGTGGHINPGLAVVSELRTLVPDLECVWVGTEDRLEARLVPAAGIPIEFIRVSFLKGRGIFGKILALIRIPRALWQSRRILRRHRPHAVVGVGGFASGPVTLWAAVRRIPTAILEQNVRPGLTNRILGRFVRRVFVTFEETAQRFAEKKVRVVGNPVRPELLKPVEDLQASEKPSESVFRILVIGGSQGAVALNKHLPDFLNRAEATGVKLRVRHSAGKGRVEETRQAYQEADRVEIVEYIDDMRSAYAWADLVICRSGASTVAELAAVGKPALYVPFPAAADNHQEKNAIAMVERGAGIIMTDDELASRPTVDAFVKLVTDKKALEGMGQAATGAARPQAAAHIAREIIEMVG